MHPKQATLLVLIIIRAINITPTTKKTGYTPWKNRDKFIIIVFCNLSRTGVIINEFS